MWVLWVDNSLDFSYKHNCAQLGNLQVISNICCTLSPHAPTINKVKCRTEKAWNMKISSYFINSEIWLLTLKWTPTRIVSLHPRASKTLRSKNNFQSKTHFDGHFTIAVWISELSITTYMCQRSDVKWCRLLWNF